MSLDKRLSNGIVYLSGVDCVLRDMNHLRSVLWAWVSEFRFALMVDVIDKEWNRLVSKLHDSKSLDDLIERHERFVLNVQAGLFLDLEYHELKDLVQDVLDVVKRFLNCEGAIYTELTMCMQLEQDISDFRQRNIIALVRDISDSFDEITRILNNTLVKFKSSKHHGVQAALFARLVLRTTRSD